MRSHGPPNALIVLILTGNLSWVCGSSEPQEQRPVYVQSACNSSIPSAFDNIVGYLQTTSRCLPLFENEIFNADILNYCGVFGSSFWQEKMNTPCTHFCLKDTLFYMRFKSERVEPTPFWAGFYYCFGGLAAFTVVACGWLMFAGCLPKPLHND